jgi:hypothetical protein
MNYAQQRGDTGAVKQYANQLDSERKSTVSRLKKLRDAQSRAKAHYDRYVSKRKTQQVDPNAFAEYKRAVAHLHHLIGSYTNEVRQGSHQTILLARKMGIVRMSPEDYESIKTQTIDRMTRAQAAQRERQDVEAQAPTRPMAGGTSNHTVHGAFGGETGLNMIADLDREYAIGAHKFKNFSDLDGVTSNQFGDSYISHLQTSTQGGISAKRAENGNLVLEVPQRLPMNLRYAQGDTSMLLLDGGAGLIPGVQGPPVRDFLKNLSVALVTNPAAQKRAEARVAKNHDVYDEEVRNLVAIFQRQRHGVSPDDPRSGVADTEVLRHVWVRAQMDVPGADPLKVRQRLEKRGKQRKPGDRWIEPGRLNRYAVPKISQADGSADQVYADAVKAFKSGDSVRGQNLAKLLSEPLQDRLVAEVSRGGDFIRNRDGEIVQFASSGDIPEPPWGQQGAPKPDPQLAAEIEKYKQLETERRDFPEAGDAEFVGFTEEQERAVRPIAALESRANELGIPQSPFALLPEPNKRDSVEKHLSYHISNTRYTRFTTPGLFEPYNNFRLFLADNEVAYRQNPQNGQWEIYMLHKSALDGQVDLRSPYQTTGMGLDEWANSGDPAKRAAILKRSGIDLNASPEDRKRAAKSRFGEYTLGYRAMEDSWKNFLHGYSERIGLPSLGVDLTDHLEASQRKATEEFRKNFVAEMNASGALDKLAMEMYGAGENAKARGLTSMLMPQIIEVLLNDDERFAKAQELLGRGNYTDYMALMKDALSGVTVNTRNYGLINHQHRRHSEDLISEGIKRFRGNTPQQLDAAGLGWITGIPGWEEITSGQVRQMIVSGKITPSQLRALNNNNLFRTFATGRMSELAKGNPEDEYLKTFSSEFSNQTPMDLFLHGDPNGAYKVGYDQFNATSLAEGVAKATERWVGRPEEFKQQLLRASGGQAFQKGPASVSSLAQKVNMFNVEAAMDMDPVGFMLLVSQNPVATIEEIAPGNSKEARRMRSNLYYLYIHPDGPQMRDWLRTKMMDASNYAGDELSNTKIWENGFNEDLANRNVRSSVFNTLGYYRTDLRSQMESIDPQLMRFIEKPEPKPRKQRKYTPRSRR